MRRAVRWCFMLGRDGAARLYRSRRRGGVRRHRHGQPTPSCLHLGSRHLCAGAVHGACRDSLSDIHHPRGLHGPDSVHGHGCDCRNGRAAGDVLSNGGAYSSRDASPELSAHFSANDIAICCHNDFSHFRTNSCQNSCSLVDPHFEAHHCETICHPECAAHGWPDCCCGRADFASDDASDSSDCSALCDAHSGPHVGPVVPAVHGQSDQHGHEQRSRVRRDCGGGSDVYGEHVWCVVCWCLLLGLDCAARFQRSRRRGGVRRHGHGQPASCCLHWGRQHVRAGAVHGAGGRSDSDVHHPRGLHGRNDLLGDGHHCWIGCAVGDVHPDDGADVPGNSSSQCHAFTFSVG